MHPNDRDRFLPPIILAALVLVLGCGQGGGAHDPDAGREDAGVPPPPDTLQAGQADGTLEWRPLRRDSSVLLFNTGDTLRTGLHRIRKVGEVKGGSATYVLLSGRHCTECDAEQALYVLRPDAGTVRTTDGLGSWHMPGRLLDGESGEAYYTAEVYCGEVFPDTVGVIWFEEQLLPDGQRKKNTTLLRLDGPKPDTLVFFGEYRKSVTQKMAFNGRCRLLPGLDQTSAP